MLGGLECNGREAPHAPLPSPSSKPCIAAEQPADSVSEPACPALEAPPIPPPPALPRPAPLLLPPSPRPRRQGEVLPWALIEERIRKVHPFEVFMVRSMLSVPYFEKALYELPEEEVGEAGGGAGVCWERGLGAGQCAQGVERSVRKGSTVGAGWVGDGEGACRC